MPLKFDTSKKSENELVLEKRVSLKIAGKDYVYLMSNDFTIITEKLKSSGYHIPKPEDFNENPALAKNVQEKMSAIGATWSLTFSADLGFAILNFLEDKSETPYIVFLEKLASDDEKTSIKKIFYLIRENKSNEVKAYIDSGFDIEQCIGNGVTLLMFACYVDAYDTVEMLLSLGANINATDANRQTPLMYTTFKNSVYSAKLLLSEKNIELEKRDITGSTVLLKSINGYCHEIFRSLIKAGANVNAVNYYGQSILMYSIFKKQWVVATELIKHGADVNYSDKMGRTPLIVAAQSTESYISEANRKLRNAMVKSLINAGADTTAKDINQDTAFIIAAKNNFYYIIQLILKSRNVPENEYTQALLESIKKGHVDTLVVLLNHAEDKVGMSFLAMIFACIANNPDAIHICVDYKCNLDDDHLWGITPLMVACFSGAEKAAAQLIAYGADVNKADEDGITALMYAASKNNPNVLALLMRNSADKNARDKNGKTFEDYANEFDSRTFQQLLLDRMKSKLPESERNRKDEIPQEHQPFCERFYWYMQKYFERFPKNKEPDIYKSAGISKQTFSKIKTRNPNSRPKKDTILQLALGLKLTLNETEDLLQCAGYAFSERDKKDAEIKSLLSEQNYNLFDWNERIYGITNEVFFKALAISEDD